MKNIFVLILVINSFLFSLDAKQETQTDIEVRKQLEKEKKYAQEQTFYQGSDYNLKSFEVNPDAVKDKPEMDIDYSDGDDVLEMD